MAQYTLDGKEKKIGVLGIYASIKNNSDVVMYGSAMSGIDPAGENVTPIQPGESVVIPSNNDRAVFLLGTGDAAVLSGNKEFNFFKPAPKGGGGSGDGITQQQLNDTLKTYATNTSVDTKLEEYASKDEIPASLPADGGNADTVGGKSAEELIQSNPNLLLNPDFKVNQRGKSEYTGIAYTVDRWRTFDAKSKIQVVNSGIKITTLTAANENENTNPLFQIFDRPVDTYNGKQFTLSLKAINITGPWRVCIRFGKSFPSGDYVTATYRTISSEINHWTFTVPDQAVSMRIGIVQYGSDGSAIGDTITIEWIKLELGAVATPFVPPNGAEELLKCQKYCLTLTADICRNYTMNTNSLWFLISTATRLRLSPSASDISKLKVKVYGTGTIYDDFTYQIGVKSYPPAIIVEAKKANHGINTNVGGVLTVPTGMLILSADL